MRQKENIDNIREMVMGSGGESTAEERAKKLRKDFKNRSNKYRDGVQIEQIIAENDIKSGPPSSVAKG